MTASFRAPPALHPHDRVAVIAPASGFKYGGMPWRIIKLGGFVVPMWREIAEMQYLWNVPHALDDAALKKVTNILPATRFNAAMRESLIALGLAKQTNNPIT